MKHDGYLMMIIRERMMITKRSPDWTVRRTSNC